MVNNIVRSKYIFVDNNKIEILFSNYIFGLISEVHLPTVYLLLTILFTIKLLPALIFLKQAPKHLKK